MCPNEHLTEEEHINVLAEELEDILQKYILEDPFIARPFMSRAAEIRKRLSLYGILVQWKSTLDPLTLSHTITLDLFKVRKDLTPELQEIYDKWYLQINGFEKEQKSIKPPK